MCHICSQGSEPANIFRPSSSLKGQAFNFQARLQSPPPPFPLVPLLRWSSCKGSANGCSSARNWHCVQGTHSYRHEYRHYRQAHIHTHARDHWVHLSLLCSITNSSPDNSLHTQIISWRLGGTDTKKTHCWSLILTWTGYQLPHTPLCTQPLCYLNLM